ncbi:MAG: hypothetical protein SVW77_04075 [Candidatus Nanohaloarchaea archaeon]|nr:hypothetical protein [Candidatus Nanohaloarchaea archaeon]
MTELVTVSGSHGFRGPLPLVEEVAGESQLDRTGIVFDGDVQEEYPAREEALREAVDDDTVAVAGFSAGAHLALALLQDSPAVFAQDTLVLAFDPPAVLGTGDGRSRIRPLDSPACEVVLVYPSVRSQGDRIDGDCTAFDIPYGEFTYDEEDPGEEQYRRMDRAHRFQDRDDTIRSLVRQLLRENVSVQSLPGDA